ncbi:MAG: CPBP family intramembrane glutamic endopeptidase [Anaerolineae bacterium]|nr:CPBP family intramembrane glutamic endopeptidase [Anaerolineae bacterium]
MPIVAALMVLVLVANFAESHSRWQPMLRMLILAANLGLVALTLSLEPSPAALGMSIGLAALATLFLWRPVRLRLAALLPRSGFKPDSPLHMTALVLCVYLIANSLLSYTLESGLSGLRESAQRRSDLLDTQVLLAQMLIFTLFGALGVGLGTRRTLSQIFERLALRAPTLRELYIGFGVAFLMFWTVYALSILWQLLVPPEVIERQTELSGLIAENIETLSTAFWVAFTAAVGEEIAFRGALQPIFGNVFTSAVFALTHTQYAFSPALGIIFIVSLGFGWARQRYNTTVAIVAHFVYNFALAALVVFARYALDILEMMP